MGAMLDWLRDCWPGGAGALLTGAEIARQVRRDRLTITPWLPELVQANSYDVRLAPSLTCYTEGILDPLRENPWERLRIPETGLILQPGRLYLGATVETACSRYYVPLLNGKSSLGRLGLTVHVTAGFGDLGWGYDENGYCCYPTWTLEITCVHPVRLYPYMRIAQVAFLRPHGRLNRYQGRYHHQSEPAPSRAWQGGLLVGSGSL